MTHQHEFVRFADFLHAPAGKPPAHTHVTVLTCACGDWDVFPAENFQLCIPLFQRQLTRFMRSLGLTRLDIVRQGRVLVDAGGGHECREWRSPEGRCLLCDRRLPPAKED